MDLEAVAMQEVPAKPKRLAITIAGAVSLGSYEAGVMWEVLDAIAQHNQPLGPDDPARIVVDVTTGASAGGMTAIILANKLLYAGSTFIAPYDNPLYDTWVKRINLQDLQDTEPDENALHSLLSSDLIASISEDTLMSRYKSGAELKLDLHGSVDQGPLLGSRPLCMKVGVAMTNLDGVDYGMPVWGAANGGPPKDEEKFVYREYADQRTRTICATSDNPEFWEPLRQVAVACGAFPIAFRAQDVVRSTAEKADYPPANLELPWPEDPRLFTYSDGGILQNQPLGIAKNLVDELDEHLYQDSRFYLFVSPHAKDGGKPDTFHEANADYFHLALQLVKVVMGQAQFRDWITAEGVNQRVYLMDQRATGLAKGMAAGTVEIAPLQATARAVLDMLFPRTGIKAPGDKESEDRDHALIRIAQQYASEVRALISGGKPGAAEAFVSSMVAFEAAAGLGARDTMKIYGVTAKDSELAGAGVESFLGFFDQSYRDHDYDVGRKHARDFLLQHGKPGSCTLGPIVFDPARHPLRKIDESLNGIGISQVKRGVLRCFESGLKQRVGQMIDLLVKGRFFNWLAKRIGGLVLGAGFDLWIAASKKEIADSAKKSVPAKVN